MHENYLNELSEIEHRDFIERTNEMINSQESRDNAFMFTCFVVIFLSLGFSFVSLIFMH